MIIKLRNPRYLVYIVTFLLVLAIIGVGIYFLVRNSTDKRLARGAVVSNGYGCSQIGANILDRGGTAVEATIATLFCEGVAMPQSMGLGGGFLMTIYQKEKGVAVSLNARETAPAAATEDMYGGNSNLSTTGGLAVAVPGELKGYWEAYKRFGGKIPWKDLVQPTIDLCRKGIMVTKYLANLYKDQTSLLKRDPPLRDEFIDPVTGRPYLEGQVVKRFRLAKTLEIIATQGADALYKGELTQGFVKDIQDHRGIITVADMNNYTVEWQEPIKINLPSNQTLYTTPIPGSGVILGFIMNILNGFLDNSQPQSTTNWQRIIESFKYGYGKRTELGDTNYVEISDLIANLTSPSYAAQIRRQISDNRTSQDATDYGAKTVQPEDHGTAHVCVLAPNGDAVSVTSTINLYFGAGFMSDSTGIILNDEMDDFSSPSMNNSFGLPPSEANFIKPGKRPLSSMVPSIVVEPNGQVLLVIGAAGGTKITTSVAQIAVKNLWFDMPIQEAVLSRRLHHQLFPMWIEFERPFENDINFINKLYRIGHDYRIVNSTGFSAVTSISRKSGNIEPATDQRRAGEYNLVY